MQFVAIFVMTTWIPKEPHFAYLEEDCDFAVFTQACAAQEIPLSTIQEQYVAHFSRNRPSFGDPQFSATFWERLQSKANE